VYGLLLTSLRPPKIFNLISRWNSVKLTFPSLHPCPQNVRESLAVPKLITPERNLLAEKIIEASECLKNWWDRGLIHSLEEEEAI
jgi:hypothetical protein